MTIELNGPLLAGCASAAITAAGFLVWFGRKVLGSIDSLSTDLGDLKTDLNTRISKFEEKQSGFDTKLDKWGERLGKAQRHIAVLQAMSGSHHVSDTDDDDR